MTHRSRFLLTLLASLTLAVSAWAQSLADPVVGYWATSSGTPVTLAYGENDQKLIMRIDEGEDIEVWLNGSRDGSTVLTFYGPGGETITGVHEPASDSIILYQGDQELDSWGRQ